MQLLILLNVFLLMLSWGAANATSFDEDLSYSTTDFSTVVKVAEVDPAFNSILFQLSKHNTTGGASSADAFSAILTYKNDKVVVEVVGFDDNASTTLRNALDTVIDFETIACRGYVCSGYMPPGKYLEIEALPEVRFVFPVISETRQAGSKANEAIWAHRVDEIRQRDPSLTGKGLKIGVLSDSYDSSQTAVTDAATDISTGDLPAAGVTVLAEYFENSIDEGRAMLQLIHDLAPEAELLFHTAFPDPLTFVNGIEALANAGCDVIVDDIAFLREPFFQDGRIAQAANDVAEKQGIPYFSAAGNSGSSSWEGAFNPTGRFIPDTSCELHHFGDGSELAGIGVPADSRGRVVLQWDEAFASVSGGAGAAADLDLLLFERVGDNVPPRYLPLFSDVATNTGSDPVALVATPPRSVDTVFYVAITHCSGPRPAKIKSIVFQAASPWSSSSTSFGHPNARFTAGVGASFFQETPEFGKSPPILEEFSSRGGLSILFDRDGTRLSTPEIRSQPRFVGTDGNINTFFGRFQDYSPSGEGYYFFGTSAAAPNVAAIALLLLQQSPDLTPVEVYNLLESTAIDMGEPGFDFASGFGLVDALAAISLLGPEPVDSPTYTPTRSPTENPSPAPVTPAPNPQPTPMAPPTPGPIPAPTSGPTEFPNDLTTPPTRSPTNIPTPSPTEQPTGSPDFAPTPPPSRSPIRSPTLPPTTSPTSSGPTLSPTSSPTGITETRPTATPTNILTEDTDSRKPTSRPSPPTYKPPYPKGKPMKKKKYYYWKGKGYKGKGYKGKGWKGKGKGWKGKGKGWKGMTFKAKGTMMNVFTMGSSMSMMSKSSMGMMKSK